MKYTLTIVATLGLASPLWAQENLPASVYRMVADYHVASVIAENCDSFQLTPSPEKQKNQIVAKLSAQGWDDEKIMRTLEANRDQSFQNYVLSYSEGLGINVSEPIDYCAAGKLATAKPDEVGQYLKASPQ